MRNNEILDGVFNEPETPQISIPTAPNQETRSNPLLDQFWGIEGVSVREYRDRPKKTKTKFAYKEEFAPSYRADITVLAARRIRIAKNHFVQFFNSLLGR